MRQHDHREQPLPRRWSVLIITGDRVCGIAAIFSAVKESHGLEVNAIFNSDDLPVKYEAYSPLDCPYCRQNMRIEAVVNGFGYSKI